MREDYQESLDRMFPNGYVIVYTNSSNSNVRVNMYNPNLTDKLHLVNEILINKDDINYEY